MPNCRSPHVESTKSELLLQPTMQSRRLQHGCGSLQGSTFQLISRPDRRESESQKYGSEISGLVSLADEWPKAVAERERVTELQTAILDAERQTQMASYSLAQLPAAENAATLLSEAASVSREYCQSILAGSLGCMTVDVRFVAKRNLRRSTRLAFSLRRSAPAYLMQARHELLSSSKPGRARKRTLLI